MIPTHPHSAAGSRIDPAVSVPIAAHAIPAGTEVADPPEKLTIRALETDAAPVSANPTVLLVDDNRNLLHFLERLMATPANGRNVRIGAYVVGIVPASFTFLSGRRADLDRDLVGRQPFVLHQCNL